MSNTPNYPIDSVLKVRESDKSLERTKAELEKEEPSETEKAEIFDKYVDKSCDESKDV